ncbi:MAG: hypothetical protein ACTTGJ_01365 [Clostridium sp.]
MRQILKKKNFIKLNISILLVVLSLIAMNMNVLGLNLDQYKPQEGTGNDKIKTYGQTIIGLVQFVGAFILIAALIFLGVAYVSSPEGQKAKIKDDSIKFIVGAFFILGGLSIVRMVVNITTGLT